MHKAWKDWIEHWNKRVVKIYRDLNYIFFRQKWRQILIWMHILKKWKHANHRLGRLKAIWITINTYSKLKLECSNLTLQRRILSNQNIYCFTWTNKKKNITTWTLSILFDWYRQLKNVINYVLRSSSVSCFFFTSSG